MKKLLLMVPLIGLTAGCAYPVQSLTGSYAGQRPMYPRMPGPQFNLASLPIGRWDNVMMTAVGTPLLVLMMNGTTATGEVVAATNDTLRLRVASGEVTFAAADVMRVDRLAGGTRSASKDAARGAAFGAGVVGVLGLIAGHAPPARVFAAGAIIGAEQNVEFGSLARGATTIYLAEAAAPAVVHPGPDEASPAARAGSRGRCAPGVTQCSSQLRFRSR
jgi:hypothetical protein